MWVCVCLCFQQLLDIQRTRSIGILWWQSKVKPGLNGDGHCVVEVFFSVNCSLQAFGKALGRTRSLKKIKVHACLEIRLAYLPYLLNDPLQGQAAKTNKVKQNQQGGEWALGGLQITSCSEKGGTRDRWGCSGITWMAIGNLQTWGHYHPHGWSSASSWPSSSHPSPAHSLHSIQGLLPRAVPLASQMGVCLPTATAGDPNGPFFPVPSPCSYPVFSRRFFFF